MRILNADVMPKSNFRHTTEFSTMTEEIRSKRFLFDVNSLVVGELSSIDEAGKIKEGEYFGMMSRTKPVFKPRFSLVPRMLVFQTTHRCNLKCRYCFVEKHRSRDMDMSFATGKSMVDYLFPKRESMEGAKFGFFGGEPMMNWPFVVQMVRYITGRAYPTVPHFGMTTNGTLIAESNARFLRENGFSFVFSIDGPESIHNLNRRMGKVGSFDRAMEGLILLSNAGLGPSITLRATYTSDIIDSIVDSVIFLNKLVSDGLASHVDIQPAFLSETACIDKTKERERVTTEKLEQLDAAYLQIADWYVQEVKLGKKPIVHGITKFLERLLYCTPYGTECGAGQGYFSADAKGNLYSCHRVENSFIGNALYGGIDEELRAPWIDNRIYRRHKCMQCNIRFVCGGGCKEESIGHGGIIQEPYESSCTIKKCLFRAALWIMSACTKEELSKVVPPKQGKKGTPNDRDRNPSSQGTTNNPCQKCVDGGSQGDISKP